MATVEKRTSQVGDEQEKEKSQLRQWFHDLQDIFITHWNSGRFTNNETAFRRVMLDYLDNGRNIDNIKFYKRHYLRALACYTFLAMVKKKKYT